MGEKCEEHSKVCGDLGGINANITNLTAAVLALTAQINTLSQPIYARINFVEEKVDKHESESAKYREKIIVTEKVLQTFMQHQDDKEKSAMWRIGITVTVINMVVMVLMKVFIG